MELERVVSEIEERGQYWRGDCQISYINGQAIAKLKLPDPEIVKKWLPALPSEIYSQIIWPNFEEIIDSADIEARIVNGWLIVKNSGDSIKQALSPILCLIESISWPDVHITKRSGGFILILNEKAVYISPNPKIVYCPLRDRTGKFLGAKKLENVEQECLLITNKKIDKLGMFTGERKIRECQARVPFGASEMIMDSMKNGLVDAAVIVCEGAGTVIVSKPEYAQGIGEAMTGVFYTTPKPELIKRLEEQGVFVVFPLTAEINQAKGVEAAIKQGHKKIAVTLAGDCAEELAEIKKMRRTGVEIINLALCTTGIKKKSAQVIVKEADLVWGCASKHIGQLAPAKTLIQIGLKIPVYVLTKQGWNFAKSRILAIDSSIDNKLKKLKLKQSQPYFIAHKKPGKLYLGLMDQIDKKLVDKPKPFL